MLMLNNLLLKIKINLLITPIKQKMIINLVIKKIFKWVFKLMISKNTKIIFINKIKTKNSFAIMKN
jgi:hypothetical protein